MSELHPLLATRWSPRAFDPAAQLADHDIASLLEAARWAPSVGNSQPWRFLVGRRHTETHKRIFTNLGTASQRWASSASALIVAGYVVDPGTPHAAYDLGQAVAHLSVQATALDLPDDVLPKVVLAVGRLGDPGALPPDLRTLEITLRRRRPRSELAIGAAIT
jgi:nitroreductase